jgi:Family of unknown function (DUF6317)
VSGGFQVAMQDLLNLSRTFNSESGTCRAIMPDEGPACPDAGDGAVNGMMQAVTEAVGLAHVQLASVMALHASKLHAAHDRYQDAEMSNVQLASKIAAAARIS